jgi:hypothetical protein
MSMKLSTGGALLDHRPRSPLVLIEPPLFGGLQLSALLRDGETTDFLRGMVVLEALLSFAPLLLLEPLLFLL